MIRHRVGAAACAAALSVLVVPPAAAKPPPPASGPAGVSALRLVGVCPWSEGADKEVGAVLLGSRLLSPYALLDDKGTAVALLKPYQVTAAGEGLKSRHLLPGVYTRPGKAPRNPVTCDFSGSTVDGAVSITVVGTATAIRRCRR